MFKIRIIYENVFQFRRCQIEFQSQISISIFNLKFQSEIEILRLKFNLNLNLRLKFNLRLKMATQIEIEIDEFGRKIEIEGSKKNRELFDQVDRSSPRHIYPPPTQIFNTINTGELSIQR